MGLLEGLELKEKLYSETYENKDFRIDSQFYTQEPYYNPILNYDKIGNLIHNAQYGVSISMNEEGKGYPIYRMNEIHNMLCDSSVSKSADISQEELETFSLNDRDVVFNRTNSFEWVGRTGIYRKKDNRNYVFASYLVRFIPNQELLLPEYLTAFLNSKYGVQDIKRRARQSINQTNVNPEEVKAIYIPLLSINFQQLITEAFNKAYDDLINSEILYNNAETLLLDEIGLKNFKPNEEGINVKSFKSSFTTTGRLDAEYYQPKYDDYLGVVYNYSNGYENIDTACVLKAKNYKAEKESRYKYVELSNIGTTGDIKGCTIDFGNELPSRARRKILEGDVIISSVEGSLESCALVTSEYSEALCSTGFYVINSKKINSETLLILFKSKLMQQLLKQNCSGTILTALNKDDFLNIPIPIINIDIQKSIAVLIKESYKLKNQSEKLLDKAKRAVEIAIEEDEESALRYINKNS